MFENTKNMTQPAGSSCNRLDQLSLKVLSSLMASIAASSSPQTLAVTLAVLQIHKKPTTQITLLWAIPTITFVVFLFMDFWISGFADFWIV
jgi:hypothetical protein